MAIRMISVVVVVLASSTGAIAQLQSTPEEMTGMLRVNGVDSGTAYLVSDRVIITCAHCLYNPDHGFRAWPVRPSMVEYCPCKTMDRRGQPISRGKFRGVRILWEERSWHRYADNSTALNHAGSAEYKERSRLDWAVILLDRAPSALGHFVVSSDEVPGKYVSGGILELGYPRIARGMLRGGTVTGAGFYDEKEWFSADGLNVRDAQGASGGPFFYRNEYGKWVAFAIHNYAGSVHATNWAHRRITPEIVSAIERLAGR